jgi:hypothetical protein
MGLHTGRLEANLSEPPFIVERVNPESGGSMTLTAVPHVADLDPDLDQRPTCECRHDEGPCGKPATAWVTAVCQVPDCECGAWSGMACTYCLISWKRMARRDGVRLRIHPLG